MAELNAEEDKLREKVEAYNAITAESLRLSEMIEDAKNRMYSLHSKVSAKRSEAKSIESYKGSLAKRKEQLLADYPEIVSKLTGCGNRGERQGTQRSR